MGEQQKSNQTEQDLNHVLKARRDKLAELQAAGKDPFQITKYDVTVHSTDVKEQYAEYEGKEVSIAGRMMSKRVMGKASFCNVQDLKGNIQCYVCRDDLGEDTYKDFKKMDIGDIVGVKGTAFTTKTGEISIHATEGRDLDPCPFRDPAFQESPDPSGEVPWTDQYGYPLPPEICGPDHERGCKGYLHQAFQDPGRHP